MRPLTPSGRHKGAYEHTFVKMEPLNSSDECIMRYYLRKAYKGLLKKHGSDENVYNSGFYQCKVYRELESETENWPYNLYHLLNYRNWNHKRLINEYGYIRKPIAYFNLYITDKGNLVLDWYPSNYSKNYKPLEETDWVYFSDDWYGGQEPNNRTMMIRDFEHFIYRSKKDKFDDVESFLLRGIKDLIENIYRFAEYYVEVVRITDLYLTDEPGKSFPAKIVSANIRNVEEVIKEARVKHKKNWISEVCKEFNLTPELFLKAFKENEMKYAPTARQFTTKSKRLTESKVRKLVRELYDFPDIYDTILSEPPKGVQSRNANVVPFPNRK